MKFAKILFNVAGIWGVILLLPLYFIFDLIGGHCGSTPSVIWNDVTAVTFDSGTVGRTMYPRPGRTVPACAPTAAAPAGQQ